jgi:hypothetical protein
MVLLVPAKVVDARFPCARIKMSLANGSSSGCGVIQVLVGETEEKIQSQVLMGQMAEYFLHTSTGRLRSSRILPEPFFVHSDQATLTQVADLIAYVVSWAVRLKGMDADVREELEPFAKAIRDLRYRAVNVTQQGDFNQWSFVLISDLRPKSEREM